MPEKFVIPKLELPYLTGRKLHAQKIQDGYENKTWAEYFTFLTNKLDISLQPNSATAVRAGTESLFDMWMSNFAENLPYIRSADAHSISELATPTVTDAPEHSAVVIGRGPSVFNNSHLKLLADNIKNGYSGKIIASDGILIDCLKHGIIPDLTVSVDGSILINKWYDHSLVKNLKVALPVTINNTVYKTCVANGCTVHWYLGQFDNYASQESVTRVIRSTTKTPKNPNGLVMMSLGGNAGSAGWVFAVHVLKCSPVALIGIDFGYPEGTPLVETPYYSSMIEQPVDITFHYEEVYHPYFKTKAQIDRVFDTYKQNFLGLAQSVEYWYLKAGGTINCTEGGTLWGPNVRCMKFADFLDKYRR